MSNNQPAISKEEVLKVISLSADEIEELAHKHFSPMKNKQGEEYQQLVGQNPNGWRKHIRSFTAGYKAGVKAIQEYAELHQQQEVKP